MDSNEFLDSNEFMLRIAFIISCYFVSNHCWICVKKSIRASAELYHLHINPEFFFGLKYHLAFSTVISAIEKMYHDYRNTVPVLSNQSRHRGGGLWVHFCWCLTMSIDILFLSTLLRKQTFIFFSKIGIWSMFYTFWEVRH